MQVAGLIELAGVVDDWWSLGREMEVDSKTTEVEEVRKLVKRRRQELIDLIFKYTLHLDDQTESVSAASTERQRAEMVQNVRSQLLRDHLSPTSDQSSSDEQQPGFYEEYWRHFNLSDAYLSGSDLRNACLKNTKLSGADLRSANLKGVNLQGADLENADLSGANLKDAKLRGANLQDANLINAHLGDAKLRGANLQDAKLWGAKLRWADLTDVNLRGAELMSADLRSAGVERLYSGTPIYNDDPMFPDNYDADQAGFVHDFAPE